MHPLVCVNSEQTKHFIWVINPTFKKTNAAHLFYHLCKKTTVHQKWKNCVVSKISDLKTSALLPGHHQINSYHYYTTRSFKFFHCGQGPLDLLLQPLKGFNITYLVTLARSLQLGQSKDFNAMFSDPDSIPRICTFYDFF